MLLDGTLSSSLCKWVSSLGGKWGQGGAGLVIWTLWSPSEVRLSWQQIIITKVPSTQPLPCLLYLWTLHRGSDPKVLLHLTKQRLGSCALAQALLWEAVGFSKSFPPSFSKPWSDHWRIQEDEMVSTSRAPPQSYWKLFEGNQGPAGYKKTGCLHQDGSLCVHPQQGQGLQTAELWLLQLRRGKDFSRLIVPGKLNRPCFRFGQPKPCRLFLPLHKISEVTKLRSFLWYQKKKVITVECKELIWPTISDFFLQVTKPVSSSW